MKNKKIVALLGILLAGSMAVSMSACGNSNDSAASAPSPAPPRRLRRPTDSSKDDSAAIPTPRVSKRSRSMKSTPTRKCGPLTVNAVYFQPIDMEPSGMGLKAADASFHLEADIHANKEGHRSSATARATSSPTSPSTTTSSTRPATSPSAPAPSCR